MTVLLMLLMASLGGLGAVVGAAGLLILGSGVSRLLSYLVSLAAGTLLAGALLGLVPEALELSTPIKVMWTVLGGLLAFFVLERLLIWRHGHGAGEDGPRASGYLVLVGDTLHNFMDGVAIGVAFTVSSALGISTALAVAAHEVPQEVGDFGVLLHSGFKPRRAFLLNGLSAFATIPGALVAYMVLPSTDAFLATILALSASSFLYIALTDLVPHLHGQVSKRALPIQLGLIGVGILITWLIQD